MVRKISSLFFLILGHTYSQTHGENESSPSKIGLYIYISHPPSSPSPHFSPKTNSYGYCDRSSRFMQAIQQRRSFCAPNRVSRHPRLALLILHRVPRCDARAPPRPAIGPNRGERRILCPWRLQLDLAGPPNRRARAVQRRVLQRAQCRLCSRRVCEESWGRGLCGHIHGWRTQRSQRHRWSLQRESSCDLYCWRA